MDRLVDEIVVQLAYIDTGSERVDYLVVSCGALQKIKRELAVECKIEIEKLKYEDIVKKLTIEYLTMPGSFSFIDYFFTKKCDI